MSLIVLLLHHLCQESRPSALIGMFPLLLQLFPLVSSAVYSDVTAIVHLDDPHLLPLIIAFIRHHERNSEAHHRPMVLHDLIVLQ